MYKLLMLLSIAWIAWLVYRTMKTRQSREDTAPKRKKSTPLSSKKKLETATMMLLASNPF